jgi:hypothetical protein
VGELPPEGEKLLAVAPADFVQERDGLARELRGQGRSDEAAAVAGLRKPSVVVLAVNRAARDRPQAARSAAAAAERIEKAQSGAHPEAFGAAMRDLDEAVDLLAEVAVANVSGGTRPTDAMRRRVYDLLRRAVAIADTRDALARGILREEPEAAGFTGSAAMAAKPRRRAAAASAKQQERRDRGEARRKERKKELRAQLAAAEEALAAAEKAVREAERERVRSERAAASIRAKLDRLD